MRSFTWRSALLYVSPCDGASVAPHAPLTQLSLATPSACEENLWTGLLRFVNALGATAMPVALSRGGSKGSCCRHPALKHGLFVPLQSRPHSWRMHGLSLRSEA